MVIIVVLSILLYREKRFSKTFVVKVIPALERDRVVSDDLPSQIWWLRRHLKKTLSVLETEYGLEPIPVKDTVQNFKLKEELKIHRPPRPPKPFVIAYEKPEPSPYGTYLKDYGSRKTFID